MQAKDNLQQPLPLKPKPESNDAGSVEARIKAEIVRQPNNAQLHSHYGSFLHSQGRYKEAEQFMRRALELSPNDPTNHNNLGVVLKYLRQFSSADSCFRQAIAINPSYADPYMNLGNLLFEQGHLPQSQEYFREALRRNPELMSAYSNLGLAHVRLKEFAEAEACYRRALQIAPNHFRIKFNLATLYLLQGNFEAGWPLYETPYRYDNRLSDQVPITPFLPYPQWQGQSVAGKSLLIWYEQGFGDVLQFARYVKILKTQGAKKITFVCQKVLQTLLASLDGADWVLSDDQKDLLENYDYWTFLLSIPILLKTRLDTIPNKVGYIAAPTDRVKYWKSRIPQRGYKVGLVWKGSLNQPNDQRSLSGLETLKPLWSIPGVTFISLQKGQGEEEAKHAPPDQPLLQFGSEIKDFSDTAAVVELLDLVITIDTAVAHLVAALGKPVWMMTSFVPDWRWLLDREDCPWYPTLRLFRQTHPGQWAHVIDRIKIELNKTVRSAHARPSGKSNTR